MNDMNSSAAVDAVDTVEDLGLAIVALESLSKGVQPSAMFALPGYQAIEMWAHMGYELVDEADAERMLLDAAHGLRLIALGDALRLDDDGRERAGRLADMVRQLQEALEADFTGLWCSALEGYEARSAAAGLFSYTRDSWRLLWLRSTIWCLSICGISGARLTVST